MIGALRPRRTLAVLAVGLALVIAGDAKCGPGVDQLLPLDRARATP